MAEELYKRQTDLQLDIPHVVTVIGCGGVGTWVAYGLALAGVKKMILLDHDAVEEHNRNRTMYLPYEVGFMKVTALASRINDVRPNCEVIAIPKRTDKLSEEEFAQVNEGVVIDCRDNIRNLDGIKQPILKAGYDGTKITLHLNPDYNGILGDVDGAYRITPSWVGTPLIIAGMCLHFICQKERTNNELIVSFDANDLPSLVLKGQVMKK